VKQNSVNLARGRDAARTRAVLGTLLLSLAGTVDACGLVHPLGDDGTSQSSTSAASADTGVSCGTDPQSGVNLCLGTTECPDTKLNLDDFPDCGFRTTKGSYDLECVCNGNALCPVGVASSCDELPGLFAKKSLADICNQAADGMCTDVEKAQPAAGAAPATPTRSPTCDDGCAMDCAGSPPCLQACGC